MKSTCWVLGVVLLSTVAFGRSAPSFRGELVTGDRIALQDFVKPKKGLLVCFWATWCVPCMEELRMLSEKFKTDPQFPLTVLTVNVDSAETSSDVKPTISQQKLAFPVVLDPRHEIFSRYHQGKSLPFSALIDEEGNIAATFEGLNENIFRDIRSALANRKVFENAE